MMRPGEERHAEALGIAQSDVGAERGGGFEQPQAHHIGGNGNHRALRFHGGDHVAQLGHIAVFADVLEQRAEKFA